MIAKISSSENLAGALGYNFKKVVSGDASVLLAEGLYANPEGGYTMEEVLSDMQAAIPKKCRTKNVVFHCSLNPHPDEKLSDEQLTQIAQEYMQTLGYGEQPYIVFKHHYLKSVQLCFLLLKQAFVGLARLVCRQRAYCVMRYSPDALTRSRKGF